MTRNRILGGLAIVWGAAIVARWLLQGSQGEGAYRAGSSAGVIVGGVLLVAGAVAFFRKPKR